MNQNLQLKVKGHVHVEDDLGQVLLDKDNAIHPQNMARIIARGLSNENNSTIYRIAFGNGGTITNAAYTITYRTPNDGQPPDNNTWDSRLYNETYSEIIDEGNVTLNTLLGTDPGSTDANTGVRPSGGANPADDPPSIPHVSGPGVRSNELGLISEVVVTAYLNAGEPISQFANDNLSPTENTESSFVFDEIGLYSSGAPATATLGYQQIDVNNKTSLDDTGLSPSTTYSFTVSIDGTPSADIVFTTPGTGSGTSGEILYGDLCEAINTGDVNWALGGIPPLPNNSVMRITDTSGQFNSILGAETYGYLMIQSGSTTPGEGTSVEISAGAANDLIAALGGTLLPSVDGAEAGVQNDPTNPTNERERLLSHIIFSPITKVANREITITYTISILIARQDDLSECL